MGMWTSSLLQFSQPKMIREWPEPQGSDLCEQFHLITLLCRSSLIIVCVCHNVEGLGDSLEIARQDNSLWKILRLNKTLSAHLNGSSVLLYEVFWFLKISDNHKQ